MYIDNKEMLQLIIDHQNLSDDVDNTWLKKYMNAPRRQLNEEQMKDFEDRRKDFKEMKYKFYENKNELFSYETEEEKKTRRKMFKKVEKDLVECFYKIVNGLITTSEFYASSYDEKEDMKSEAIWVMFRNVEKFDTRRNNPFSYFTEMAKNAFRYHRLKERKFSDNQVTVDFAENLDSEYSVFWLE